MTADDIRRQRTKYQTVSDADGTTYHRVEMELQIMIGQARASAELVWGRTEGSHGSTGAPGHMLASQELPFPE